MKGDAFDLAFDCFKAKADADSVKASLVYLPDHIGSIPLSGAVKIHAKLPDPLDKMEN